MGCYAQKEPRQSSLPIQNSLTTTTRNLGYQTQTKEEVVNLNPCIYCKQSNEFPVVNMTKCKDPHYCHQKCFQEYAAAQIEKKQSLFIKCKCGTKATTQQIRMSNLPDRLFLLHQLFRNQLQILIKQDMRKMDIYKDVMKEFEESKGNGDFYFFPNKQELEYEETPE